MRYRLAQDAFRRTAQYDAAIAAYLAIAGTGAVGARAQPDGSRIAPAGGGARPEPALRRESAPDGGVLPDRAAPRGGAGRHASSCTARSSATTTSWISRPPWRLLLEFEDPAAVVIKHTNPVRRRPRAHGRRRDGARQGLGPGVDLRRHRRRQPHPRLAPSWRRSRGIFVEILFAPVVHARRARGARRTKKKLPGLRGVLRSARRCRRGSPSTAASSGACSSRRRISSISIRRRSRR